MELLLDGQIDASFVRLPIDMRGLTVIPLYAEKRGAAAVIGDHLQLLFDGACPS